MFDRPGWSGGNSLVLITQGEQFGSQRAYSHVYSPSSAPLLMIDYTYLPIVSSNDHQIDGEVPILGVVSGSYTDTHAADGIAQTITEEALKGGKQGNRRQSYEHAWTTDVVGGPGGVQVSVDAWVSGSEGANFYYSLDDGATRHLMFTVDNDSIGPQVFFLPAGTSGPVRIEVQDAAQSRGEAVDSVSVDHIVLTSNPSSGEVPASPSAMSVTATTGSSVSLQFTDNSINEFGFKLFRATADPFGDCAAGSVVETLGASAGTGSVTHTDNAVSADTTYWYWAVSFNGAGDNGSCSNADSGTTVAAPPISLTATVSKSKGNNMVTLDWTGTTQVDIYQDGNLVTTINDGGSHTINMGKNNGSVVTYQVCEEGSSSECSAEVTVNF